MLDVASCNIVAVPQRYPVIKVAPLRTAATKTLAPGSKPETRQSRIMLELISVSN